MAFSTSRRHLWIAGFFLAAVALALAWRSGLAGQALTALTQENVGAWVDAAGFWGPLLVIALMTVAVVASPIPSAPIALAAGAAYGHVMGTLYVLVGAEAGALIAFALARFLGRDVVLRWFGERVDMGLLGSQNVLTWTVFATRLMPFVSFDLVSYAAGLSCLRMWRFALATLAGIIPAAYFLAHFGNEVAANDLGRASWAVLGAGLITGLPLVIAALRRPNRKDP